MIIVKYLYGTMIWSVGPFQTRAPTREQILLLTPCQSILIPDERRTEKAEVVSVSVCLFVSLSPPSHSAVVSIAEAKMKPTPWL